MVVADGQGLPIGLHVASAQPHESQLADATLATVRVPQPRGRPRTRPQEFQMPCRIEGLWLQTRASKTPGSFVALL